MSRAGAGGRGASRPPAGPAPMLSFARELPNVCSLAGLLGALLGLYFAVCGVYPAALTALLWALVFDWSDGRIARRMRGRTADQRAFGAQLDSLIDLVSFSVAPALLLLSVGHFGPWFVPGAFVILASGVIRLSYFNVFGLLDDATYRGLALDNNVLVLALLFVFEPLVGATCGRRDRRPHLDRVYVAGPFVSAACGGLWSAARRHTLWSACTLQASCLWTRLQDLCGPTNGVWSHVWALTAIQ